MAGGLRGLRLAAAPSSFLRARTSANTASARLRSPRASCSRACLMSGEAPGLAALAASASMAAFWLRMTWSLSPTCWRSCATWAASSALAAATSASSCHWSQTLMPTSKAATSSAATAAASRPPTTVTRLPEPVTAGPRMSRPAALAADGAGLGCRRPGRGGDRAGSAVTIADAVAVAGDDGAADVAAGGDAAGARGPDVGLARRRGGLGRLLQGAPLPSRLTSVPNPLAPSRTPPRRKMTINRIATAARPMSQ